MQYSFDLPNKRIFFYLKTNVLPGFAFEHSPQHLNDKGLNLLFFEFDKIECLTILKFDKIKIFQFKLLILMFEKFCFGNKKFSESG